MYIKIDYDDRKAARVVGGIALLGVSIPFFYGGVAAIIEAAESDDRGLAALAAPVLGAVAAISIGFGLGAGVGGILLLARDPQRYDTARAVMSPTLHVGLGGAGLSLKF